MAIPQAIFLDAVGTIFGVKGSVGEAYSLIAAEFDVIVDAKQLDRAFGRAFTTVPKMAFPGVAKAQILELEKQWWRSLAIQVFSQVGAIDQFGQQFEDFFERLFAYFALADPWFIYPETIAALTTWQQQGISLHLISNFDSRIFAVLEALKLATWFDSVTISTQAGAAKPDRQIFDHALAHAQRHYQKDKQKDFLLTPNQVCHIGDSYSEDYAGAIAAGFLAVWLDRNLSASKSIPTIYKLTDFAFPNLS